MKTAAKVLLNAARVARRSKLIEMTLIVISVPLSERGDVKAADPMIKVRPLIGEYHAEVEAKRRALRDEVAAEDTKVSAYSMTICHATADAPTLQQESDQASSLVVDAEVEVVRIETELARAQQVLAEYQRHQEELVGCL